MSDACQKIDFYFGLHVDGSAFSYIALALASTPPNGIRCNVGGVAANQGANYDTTTNTFNVPSDSFASTNFGEKMVIVHEATHAVADATMPGTHPRGELQETAAMVAGALFNIYSAPALSGPYPINPAGQGLWETAHNVAMQIAGSPGYALDPNVASPLRLAILANSTYSFLKTSPRYSEDGVSL